ncbi:MAG: hypothetical protein K8S55_03205 [Phycisphaerae bacterium]|nr:hypothetical protein [Phycisphaerae bacterium]
MSRYARIKSAGFDGVSLSLPMGLKISRSRKPLPATADNHTFPTSLETAPATLTAELRTRDTAAAEGLELGREGTLSIEVVCADDNTSRTITLTGTVLVGCELAYSQANLAEATLSFAVRSSDGTTDPFTAGAA